MPPDKDAVGTNRSVCVFCKQPNGILTSDGGRIKCNHEKIQGLTARFECQVCSDFRSLNLKSKWNHECRLPRQGGGAMWQRYGRGTPQAYEIMRCQGCIELGNKYCDVDSFLHMACSYCKSSKPKKGEKGEGTTTCRLPDLPDRPLRVRAKVQGPVSKWFRHACPNCEARGNKDIQRLQRKKKAGAKWKSDDNHPDDNNPNAVGCSWLERRDAPEGDCRQCTAGRHHCKFMPTIPEPDQTPNTASWKLEDSEGFQARLHIKHIFQAGEVARKICKMCMDNETHCNIYTDGNGIFEACQRCIEQGIDCVDAENSWPVGSLAKVGFCEYGAFMKCQTCHEKKRNCDRQTPCDSCWKNNEKTPCRPEPENTDDNNNGNAQVNDNDDGNADDDNDDDGIADDDHADNEDDGSNNKRSKKTKKKGAKKKETKKKTYRNCLPDRLNPPPGPLYYLAMGYGPRGVDDVKTGDNLEDWVGPLDLEFAHMPADGDRLFVAKSFAGSALSERKGVDRTKPLPPGEAPSMNFKPAWAITVEDIRQMILSKWPDAKPPNQWRLEAPEEHRPAPKEKKERKPKAAAADDGEVASDASQESYTSYQLRTPPQVQTDLVLPLPDPTVKIPVAVRKMRPKRSTKAATASQSQPQAPKEPPQAAGEQVSRPTMTGNDNAMPAGNQPSAPPQRRLPPALAQVPSPPSLPAAEPIRDPNAFLAQYADFKQQYDRYIQQHEEFKQGYSKWRGEWELQSGQGSLPAADEQQFNEQRPRHRVTSEGQRNQFNVQPQGQFGYPLTNAPPPPQQYPGYMPDFYPGYPYQQQAYGDYGLDLMSAWDPPVLQPGEEDVIEALAGSGHLGEAREFEEFLSGAKPISPPQYAQQQQFGQQLQPTASTSPTEAPNFLLARLKNMQYRCSDGWFRESQVIAPGQAAWVPKFVASQPKANVASSWIKELSSDRKTLLKTKFFVVWDTREVCQMIRDPASGKMRGKGTGLVLPTEEEEKAVEEAVQRGTPLPQINHRRLTIEQLESARKALSSNGSSPDRDGASANLTSIAPGLLDPRLTEDTPQALQARYIELQQQAGGSGEARDAPAQRDGAQSRKRSYDQSQVSDGMSSLFGGSGPSGSDKSAGASPKKMNTTGDGLALPRRPS
jgi:hypothetical protein